MAKKTKEKEKETTTKNKKEPKKDIKKELQEDLDIKSLKKELEESLEEKEEQIKEEVEEKLKKELETKIEENLKKQLEETLDEKIEKRVNLKVREEIIKEVETANKKLIREKNKKILVKNIFLILFFALILLLTYILYDEGYFDKYFNHTKENNIIEKEKKEEKINEEEEEQKEEAKGEIEEENTKLEEQKKEYSPLLEKYRLSIHSSYQEDFYNANLTEEIKHYFTLSNIDISKTAKEEDYNIIDEEDFEKEYKKLFEGEINKINFEYNGNKIRYYSKLKAFLSDQELEKNKELIEREIIEINETQEEVKITTIEGIIQEGKLYPVFSTTPLENYQGESLTTYQEFLNKITYVFKNKKLIRLEK